MSALRPAIGTGNYAMQSGGLIAFAGVVALFVGDLLPAWEAPERQQLLGAALAWLFLVGGKAVRDRVLGPKPPPTSPLYWPVAVVALLLVVFSVAGCRTSAGIGEYGGEIAGAGDSDQDVMEIIQGPGFIWYGEVEVVEHEDGTVEYQPTGVGYGMFATTSDFQGRWSTQSQQNAKMQEAMAQIIKDGMIEAVELGLGAAPLPGR